MNRQERIKHALDFLNVLYQNVTTTKFTCLCAGTDGYYPDNFYDVSIPQQRQKMAERAIALNDEGKNIALTVNLMDKIPPRKDNGKLARGTAKDITTQVAIVSDIDTEGGRHTSTEGHVYTANTEIAISYAPIPPSLIVNSGYGIHLYNLLSQPIEFTTNEQRDTIREKRNKPYISIIKNKASEMGYNTGVDSVGNLDRILRIPGTFNYSNGKNNPPLCQYRSSDIQYTAEEFDNKIKPFIPVSHDKTKEDKNNVTPSAHSLEYGQNADFDLYRASKMLEHIDSYDEEIWAKVCAYLRNIANLGHLTENAAFNLFDEWSATSPAKYNDCDQKGNTGRDACQAKWDNSTMDGDWGNLYGLARENGYNASDVTKDWYDLQGDKEYQAKKEKVSDILQKSKEKRQSAQVEEESSPRITQIGDFFNNHFDSEVEEYKKYAYRKTGFTELDEKQIFAPGLYVIGGLSALGKTTLLWQLAEQLADRGEYVIYVSYEMSALDMFSKTLARRVKIADPSSKLSAADIRRGSWNATVSKVKAELKQLTTNLNVYEAEEDNVDTLISVVSKISVQSDKSPVVFIDYLQIMPHNQRDPKQGIDEIVRKLKAYQRKTNATFIVISSFNRQNYRSNVTFESFKESGGIEYSADVVWGLQLGILNDKEEANKQDVEKALRKIPRHITLKCLKNRTGSLYNVDFHYNPRFDLIKEYIEDWDKEVDEETVRSKALKEAIKQNKKVK